MAVFNIKLTILLCFLCFLSTLHFNVSLKNVPSFLSISSSMLKATPVESLQLMITNSMRKTLIDELHYEPEEVDIMEPQVAAGVVKRMLPRPVNGIPKEWLRPKVVPSQSSITLQKTSILLEKSVDKVKNCVMIAKNFNNKYIMPVIPGLVLMGILLHDKNKVVEMSRSAITEVRSLPTACISFARLLTPKKTSDGRNKGDEEEERVDFDAFMRIQHQSLWDRFMLRIERMMGSKHER